MTDMTVYVRRLATNLLYLTRPAPTGDPRHAERRCRGLATLYGWIGASGVVHAIAATDLVSAGVAFLLMLAGLERMVAATKIRREDGPA